MNEGLLKSLKKFKTTMILAVSRFRVANHMEEAVSDAFLNRPHLVDDAAGFLGMETFVGEDPAEFYLVTRWTDEESFKTWHRSPQHKESHKGIPKGLKLDASRTKLLTLHRLFRSDGTVEFEQSVTDAAPFLARYLASTHSVHFVAATRQGTILNCNQAAVEALGR